MSPSHKSVCKFSIKQELVTLGSGRGSWPLPTSSHPGQLFLAFFQGLHPIVHLDPCFQVPSCDPLEVARVAESSGAGAQIMLSPGSLLTLADPKTTDGPSVQFKKL